MSFREVIRKYWRYVVVSLSLLVGITLLSQSVFASVGVSKIQAAVPASHTLAGDPKAESRCPGTFSAGVCDHTQQFAGGTITDTPTSTSTPTASVTPTPSIAGDANSDNVVDGIDYSIVKAYFGRQCNGDPLCTRADFDHNGVVNADDFHVLLVNFGMLGASPGSPPPSSGDAFLSLQPGIAGNCSAPPNGGTVQVGCRFVLDMMVNMVSVPDGVAMQSYMTFTSSILQNASVPSIASSCVPTNSVTGDLITFDAQLQQEVCDGPAPCVFRGRTVAPGSLAYASGALSNCGFGCGGTFRVAQTGWCAVAPGQAVLRWQFSPPAPRNRHTAIVDVNGNMVQKRSLFTDYVIYVVAVPSPTPTNTPTPSPAMLVGHVIRFGSGPRNVQPISLTLTMGGTQIDYPIQNTDASGFFTVSVAGLASGTYNYRAKDPKFLANAGTVTLTGAPITQLEIGTLTAGDANNDNVLDGIDHSILKANFGRACGGDPLCARADFNNDGIVNATDFGVHGFGKLGAPPDSPVPPSSGDAFLSLQPGSGGNCSAPPNGGTVLVGCRFVLDMMVNMGSLPNGVAAQSYMTFTSSILQNARMSEIASSCVPTNTVTSDLTTFDAVLQNEICNGPAPCNFRGMTVGAGSFAYAQGALSNCPTGCGGTFRVAQTGWCAVAPGQAVLRWQFSPPAPRNRHTAIVDVNGNMVQALVSDYVINIISCPGCTNTPTYTPTNTPTFTPTPTPTNTPLCAPNCTATPTNTPTFTRTVTLTPIPTNTPLCAPNCTATPTNTPTRTFTPAPVRDAFMYFVPQGSAPPNGGTVTVGSRFVLELWLNTGSSNSTTGQQSYLTYTYDLIQNARVDQIATACVLTSTVTPDLNIFDANLQNEVCNGPGQCTFRGTIVDPGSFAYSSAAIINCPKGCGGSFRVAQVGLCAVAPGRAVLHWQFSPPAPMIRDTEIVAYNGNLIHNPSLFTDYVINIAGATYTPAPTFTPGSPTSTRTITPTSTRTLTPVRDAFVVFVPEGSAPPNGGTVTVGDRFVLGLWLNSGSSNSVTAQQSYLTYTNDLIQNARVDQIATACVLTGTITADPTTFDASLQNQVCNGPGQCNFRGTLVDPGSFAYASGGLINCPEGCGGSFRVAQVGLCAVAPGRAVLHWQFSPPAPNTRDTEIVNYDGTLVHNPALYTDYAINIVAPTSTPTPTRTPGIRGHETWEGRQPQPDPSQVLPISLTLRLVTGGPYIDYPLQNTDASGLFTVSVAGLPAGTYNWRAKGPQFLANSGTITLNGGPGTPLEAGLLRTGDANNDNVVNTADFNIATGSFGMSCGSPAYDPRADFTGDCTVNSLDFSLIRRNFGLTGAAQLNPIGP